VTLQWLNPGVDVDRVNAGQDILVPVKPPVVGQSGRRRAVDSWQTGPTEIPVVTPIGPTQQATDATDVFLASRITSQRTDYQAQPKSTSGVVMVPSAQPLPSPSSGALSGLRGGALLLIPAAALGAIGWGLAGRWLGLNPGRRGGGGADRPGARPSAVAAAAAETSRAAEAAARGELLWEQWLRRGDSNRVPESLEASLPPAVRARDAYSAYSADKNAPVEAAFGPQRRAATAGISRRRILDDEAAAAVAEAEQVNVFAHLRRLCRCYEREGQCDSLTCGQLTRERICG
jgi:hypothetical protein